MVKPRRIWPDGTIDYYKLEQGRQQRWGVLALLSCDNAIFTTECPDTSNTNTWSSHRVAVGATMGISARRTGVFRSLQSGDVSAVSGGSIDRPRAGIPNMFICYYSMPDSLLARFVSKRG